MKESFDFFSGRAYPGTLNIARWEVTTDFVASTLVDMGPITSRDNMAGIGRNKAIVLKDISAYCYLPICVEDGQELPNFTSDEIRALYSSYTFYWSLNSQATQFPVIFTKNADYWRSQLFLARFDPTVREQTVKVNRDFIDPAFQGAGINVRLGFIAEYYITDK